MYNTKRVLCCHTCVDGCEGHSTETRSCSNSLCNPILPAPVHELSDDGENGGGIEHLNSDHNDMGKSGNN